MMNEDTIRMAREAGMGGMLTDVVCTHAELERFAELVRADEREACAKICDSVNSYDNPMTANDVADAIRARGKQ